MAKQAHYQVTAQASAGGWVERHISRISRLKLAIKQTDDSGVKKRLQAEIDIRAKHLGELKSAIEEATS